MVEGEEEEEEELHLLEVVVVEVVIDHQILMHEKVVLVVDVGMLLQTVSLVQAVMQGCPHINLHLHRILKR